ncbi:MAG TPA: HAD family acid phosphatase, partial [Steroidobacteraceae bacterium]|nr:HAD family acid phosphatase [Steroidobacteraceae bacterium]
MRHLSSFVPALLLAACSVVPQQSGAGHGDTPPPQQVQVSVHGGGVPLELHWFRNSAERRALYTQIYAQAAGAVRALAQGHAANTWAVILDVDETILDNSEYQARLAVTGAQYSAATWSAWVSDRRAVALPGAVAFLHTVRDELHGRVVLVTNRNVADCANTEANLHAQALEYDAILCAPEGPGGRPVQDKNPRFA